MVAETNNIRVTGGTKLVAVIGHPIAQAKSPALLSAIAAERGHDTLFVPVDARPEDLETVLTGLRAAANFAGLIVTIPHKPAIGRAVGWTDRGGRGVGRSQCCLHRRGRTMDRRHQGW